MTITFKPVPDVQIGDHLASWLGEVIALRDTAKRRYFTVRRADGTVYTGYQARSTRIAVTMPDVLTVDMAGRPVRYDRYNLPYVTYDGQDVYVSPCCGAHVTFHDADLCCKNCWSDVHCGLSGTPSPQPEGGKPPIEATDKPGAQS